MKNAEKRLRNIVLIVKHVPMNVAIVASGGEGSGGYKLNIVI